MSAAENRKLIEDAFGHWVRGDRAAFNNLLADDLHWTVIGNSPVSGRYNSKREFRDVVRRLSEQFTTDLKVTVRDVFADGDKVAIQFESHAEARNGTAYDQTYCWVTRLEGGLVREVIAYLDTELVSKLFTAGTT